MVKWFGSALFSLLCLASVACTFNYGMMQEEGEEYPDLVMDELEFVRVREGAVTLRIQAEQAARWEDSRRMEMEQMRFVQYADRDGNVGATGSAGKARVMLDSGDVALSGGVQLIVERDDLWIETAALNWSDKDRVLLGQDNELVLIKRSDGSIIRGESFGANARRRSWEFAGPLTGYYVADQESDEDEAEPVPEAVSPSEAPNEAPQAEEAPE